MHVCFDEVFPVGLRYLCSNTRGIWARRSDADLELHLCLLAMAVRQFGLSKYESGLFQPQSM
jgi:hypothetical protein